MRERERDFKRVFEFLVRENFIVELNRKRNMMSEEMTKQKLKKKKRWFGSLRYYFLGLVKNERRNKSELKKREDENDDGKKEKKIKIKKFLYKVEEVCTSHYPIELITNSWWATKRFIHVLARGHSTLAGNHESARGNYATINGDRLCLLREKLRSGKLTIYS